MVRRIKLNMEERSNEYLVLSIYMYLLARIGVDTAENEPLKVHLILKLWDLIFTEPPRPFERSTSKTSTRGQAVNQWNLGENSPLSPSPSQPTKRLVTQLRAPQNSFGSVEVPPSTYGTSMLSGTT